MIEDPYRKHAQGIVGDVSRFRRRPLSHEEKERGKFSDFLRFLGDIAPAAGGTIGAVVGGPVGMGVGAGLGQLGGSVARAGAEDMVGSREDDERQREMDRRAIMQALMSIR